MKYAIVSPYMTPLICETLEEAESALYLLQCVGGFGQVVQVPEDTDPEPVVYDEDVSTHVETELKPTPKPRGRPRSTK